MNPQTKMGEPYPLQTPPLSAEERHEADLFTWEVRNSRTADCARPGEHRQHQRVSTTPLEAPSTAPQARSGRRL